MNEEDHESLVEELLVASSSRYAGEVHQPQGDDEEQTDMEKLPYPVRPMIAPPDAPPDWLGNRTKKHTHEGQCFCYKCYQDQYPFLSIGDPVQVHPAYPIDAPSMQEVVGIYDRRFRRLRVKCSKCAELIELEGELAMEYNEKLNSVTHVSCLPQKVRAALEQVGYCSSFLITKTAQEEVAGEE